MAPGAPHCARCGTMLLLCRCEAVLHGRDVVFILEGPALPESATAEQRLQRWQEHVTVNPSASQFDAAKFVADMRRCGILQAFARLAPRLEAMAQHYCLDSTPGGYLEVLRACGKKPGSAASREAFKGEVHTAVRRFAGFDWSRMSLFDVILVNNCYQCSDPEAFPIDDPDLKLGYDVVTCLKTVLSLASERPQYSFEPFDWQ